MPSTVSRDAYYETGLVVLSELGFGGFKLAEVCRRLEVTTGSFYHYFRNWSAYTAGLVEFWRARRVAALDDDVRPESDPRARIGRMIAVSLRQPSGTDGAIRVWSQIDPRIRETQTQVDEARQEILRSAAQQVLGDARQAELVAEWAMYLLIGHEQTSLSPDQAGLEWLLDQLLAALDSGGFTDVPARISASTSADANLVDRSTSDPRAAL
ncbi:TetR/AcrR family transcriptional regulator [Williamsia sterculiae]|nr:TetR/AcrR family transcriptional regulator [Williamsia sterculiae]